MWHRLYSVFADMLFCVLFLWGLVRWKDRKRRFVCKTNSIEFQMFVADISFLVEVSALGTALFFGGGA
jgi:hypothetical protein